MEFREIVKDIVSKDFNILRRRDDFLEALKESAETRDFNTLKRIIREIDICKIFYEANDKSPSEKLDVKNRVRKEVLDNIEVTDARADFIIDAFIYALDWNLAEIKAETKLETKNPKKNKKTAKNVDVEEIIKQSAEKITSDYEKIFETKDKKVYYDFVKRYKPIRIACMNDEERSVNHKEPPKFENYIHLAYFWGIKIKVKMFEVYLVYVKPFCVYDGYKHNFGGMKEVFESNYKSGIYRKFKALKPAIFKNSKNGFEIFRRGQIEFL